MIIPTDAKWKTFFDVAVMAGVLYTSMINLFYVTFDVEPSNTVFIINWIFEVLFYFDFILNFNQAFVNNKYEIIDSRWEITLNYLKGWFSVDFVSIFPFEPVLMSGSANADVSLRKSTKLVRMARLPRLMKLLKLLKLLRILKMPNLLK